MLSKIRGIDSYAARIIATERRVEYLDVARLLPMLVRKAA